MKGFCNDFMATTRLTAESLDAESIELMVKELVKLRDNGGRLFICGVGGSAGNATHAVNDFRKLCGIEAYSPTDNVSELTARINDEGWDGAFVEWLKVSRLSSKDVLLFFSVGGGSYERQLSVNLINAAEYGVEVGCKILGIFGRSDGAILKLANCAVVVPSIAPALVTPVSEAFQGVVWHCIVSHPALQLCKTTW